MNHMLFQCSLWLKNLFFLFWRFLKDLILISLSHRYLGSLHTLFVVKNSNLVEQFAVSLKELLLLFSSTFNKENWSIGLYEPFTSISLSINVMIACLWDVIKCPFSLALDTKSTKISFKLFQNVLKYSFINSSLPGGLLFYMLFESCMKLFRLNLSHKVFLGLQRVLENQYD